MAEFLVYDKTHWTDLLTSERFEQMRTEHSKWDQKYLARYQKGDIVEVRPDGYWTGPHARGFNQEAFKVVSIPGLPVDTDFMASKITVKMIDIPGQEKPMRQETILRRRKFRFANTLPGKIVTMAVEAISEG